MQVFRAAVSRAISGCPIGESGRDSAAARYTRRNEKRASESRIESTTVGAIEATKSSGVLVRLSHRPLLQRLHEVEEDV